VSGLAARVLTGLLQNHLQVGTQRKDAIIWSRRLANPTDIA